MPLSAQLPGVGREAVAAHFGARLRHWRRLRGRTQAELARTLEVDGSYISKLESSHRLPNSDIARGCDDALDTGGELAGLHALMGHGPGDDSRASANPLPWRGGPPPPSGAAPAARPIAGQHTVETMYRLLEAHTDIDATMGGRQIVPSVEQQAQEIIGMRIGAPDGAAADLLVLAAKFARLAGWIRFDEQDLAGSLFWHDCGQRWALAAGCPDLSAELLSRHAVVHAAGGDPAAAVAVAQSAQRLDGLTEVGRFWGLIAEARCRALSADVELCLNRLDRARQLAQSATSSLTAPPCRHDNDYLWHSLAGKCHLELALAGADPREHAAAAAEHTIAALAEVPAAHVRDQTLTLLRLARANIVLDNRAEAAARLAQAEQLSRRCTTARVHANVRRLRGYVDELQPDSRAV